MDLDRMHRYLIRLIRAAAVTTMAAAPALAYAGCAPGMYAPPQAASGQTVYNTQCASCHSADLTGGAGPPLTGEKFVSYLNFTKITGAQLGKFYCDADALQSTRQPESGRLSVGIRLYIKGE